MTIHGTYTPGGLTKTEEQASIRLVWELWALQLPRGTDEVSTATIHI